MWTLKKLNKSPSTKEAKTPLDCTSHQQQEVKSTTLYFNRANSDTFEAEGVLIRGVLISWVGKHLNKVFGTVLCIKTSLHQHPLAKAGHTIIMGLDVCYRYLLPTLVSI